MPANAVLGLITLILWVSFIGWMAWGPIKSTFFKPSFAEGVVTISEKPDRFSSKRLTFETENTTRWTAKYVRFEFKEYDKDDVVIGETTLTASNVEGHEKLRMKHEYLDDAVVRVKLARTIITNY